MSAVEADDVVDATGVADAVDGSAPPLSPGALLQQQVVDTPFWSELVSAPPGLAGLVEGLSDLKAKFESSLAAQAAEAKAQLVETRNELEEARAAAAAAAA
eukprot:INCI2113.1.p1 GENE.INCI2113.1~~INCI2113.1.p1  ORF type:complete len:110 (+),score=43.69 INCI2113.1:28-330(+)